MFVSQKCQYALRATYELAKRYGRGPVAISQIAEVQAIPAKFLELILGQLRQAGFVESRRGAQGGYLLAVVPGQLSAGAIIRFIDGPIAPVRCVSGEATHDCPLHGRCSFMGMWTRARDAMSSVYDQTTFADLIEQEQSAQACSHSYSI